MKKWMLAICAMAVLTMASAFSGKPVTEPGLKASAIMIPLGKNGLSISLLDLSRISRTDLEQLTGQKMNLPQRLAFKGAQKKLRHSINDEGVVSNKKLKKYFRNSQDAGIDGTTGFHLGGFALGFILGLIGIIVAYVINDEKKSNRVKWAWIGLAIWIGIILIAFVL